MSGTRSSRISRNTDFSIARILAVDERSYECVRQDNVQQDARRKRWRLAEEPVRYNFPNREINQVRAIREKREEYIEHAATSGGTYRDNSTGQQINDNNEDVRKTDLTWLQYTRYRPPKLPRRAFVERRTKRRTGDHPRIPFSSSQLQVLEDRYRKGAYLSRNDVVEMSTKLRLPQSKVKIWFQNRRARQRRELLNSVVTVR